MALGASRTIKVDGRADIAATTLICGAHGGGPFREDLFYDACHSIQLRRSGTAGRHHGAGAAFLAKYGEENRRRTWSHAGRPRLVTE